MIKQRRTWIYPGDTELDTARHVARAYRQVLAEVDPEACALLDQWCRTRDQDWVTPQLAVWDDNALITVADAALYLSVSESAIRKWISRPPTRLNAYVGDDGLQRVPVGQLIDIQREQRERRARRHTDRAS